MCVCEVIVCVTMCKMVCDEGVCEVMYVTNGMCQSCGRRRRADGGGGGSGYRIKNKNPTQSCGEKEPCTGYVASLFFGFAKVEVLFSMDVSETLCNAKLVCLHHCIISSYTICTGSVPR